MTFHTKLLWIKNNGVLCSMQQMDLSEFMIELDIQYYLIKSGVIKFEIRLNVL